MDNFLNSINSVHARARFWEANFSPEIVDIKTFIGSKSGKTRFVENIFGRHRQSIVFSCLKLKVYKEFEPS